MKDATTQMLDFAWSELQNDCSPTAQAHVRGLIDAAFILQTINLLERDGWMARISGCPENGEHGAGRVWCAYCGDIVPAELEDEEVVPYAGATPGL